MARGFKSGGRKPGSKNKRTKELDEATQEMATTVAKVLGIESFDGDAHAFLMLIYKNPAVPIDLRLDAAKAAVRFEKPTLGVVETGPDALQRYVARVPEKSATSDSWQQQHEPQTLQ